MRQRPSQVCVCGGGHGGGAVAGAVKDGAVLTTVRYAVPRCWIRSRHTAPMRAWMLRPTMAVESVMLLDLKSAMPEQLTPSAVHSTSAASSSESSSVYQM